MYAQPNPTVQFIDQSVTVFILYVGTDKNVAWQVNSDIIGSYSVRKVDSDTQRAVTGNWQGGNGGVSSLFTEPSICANTRPE